MKVLQVNILGATLSTGRTTAEMHEYFSQHGIESYIACPTNKDNENAFAFSTTFQKKLDYKLTTVTSRDAYHSHIPTLKLIRYIKSLSVDIVHLRVLHWNVINVDMLLTFLAKNDIATVVTMHDFWWMTGMCCHYSQYSCQKWKYGCGECPAMKNDVRQRKKDRSHEQWQIKKKGFEGIKRLAVVGVSDWVTHEVKSSYLSCARIVRRVYNWIDNSVFYPRENADSLRDKYNLRNKFAVIAVSTSWYSGDSKGLDDYLSLAAHTPKDVALVLVGDMMYEGELEENIISIPRTDDTNELACLYSMADVYLNLSKQETFGKVSAEAVCCGTPLIALDSTANGEIVPPDGILIKTPDPQEILTAIQQIRAKEKSYYVPRCVEFANERFNKEKNIEQYIDIYKELLKE